MQTPQFLDQADIGAGQPGMIIPIRPALSHCVETLRKNGCCDLEAATHVASSLGTGLALLQFLDRTFAITGSMLEVGEVLADASQKS